MNIRLDPDIPVPLYHQLAEAIRYAIATGELRAGASLPTLRAGARAWGVNLHTVRHAYSALAEQGLVRLHRRRGTVVLGPSVSGPAVDAFVSEVAREAERLGLPLSDLQSRLARLGDPAVEQPSVLVIECSEMQAADLAGQLEGEFAVRAEGWSLERPGEPPAGVSIVATYFHYNDIRVRWPERFASVYFTAIAPDPHVARVLSGGRGSRRVPVVVVERDATMATAIASDLRGVLPADRFDLQAVALKRPAAALTRFPAASALLFAPRVWAGLSSADRADPRVHEVRYLFDPRDLAELGRRMGWRARAHGARSGVDRRLTKRAATRPRSQ